MRDRVGLALTVGALLLLAACSAGDTATEEPAAGEPATSTTTSQYTTTTSTASSSSASSTTSPIPDLVTYQVDFGRLGPIQVGMSFEEVEDAAGVDLRRSGDFPGPECADWFVVGLAGVDFLALDDRLASVAVGPPFTTEQGVGIGATTDEILDAYGEGNVEERTNRFQIKELLVTPADAQLSGLGILFSMTPGGGEVEIIETGTVQALNRDEGCA